MIETLALAAMLHHSVVPGDTEWGIAHANGVGLTQMEQANPQIADPNMIFVGQTINIPSFGGGAPPLPSGAIVGSSGDGDHDGDDGGGSAPATSDGGGNSSSSSAASSQAQAPSSGGGGGSVSAAPGSFQACVIQRESGGNPSAVNASSGAGGLYQFLPSTWIGLGFSGLPQNASVATQNAAFHKAFAQFGTQPWTPSDGC